VEALVEDLLDDVARIGGVWLHVAAFLLAFGETAFLTDLLVPGEVGMVVVGAAGARGNEPLPTLIAAAALGATVGDSVGWVLGRTVAPRLIERYAWTRRHVQPKVERAHAYFEQRGGAAVFLGRFVGALRSVVSVVAGMSGMPFRRFLAWNVAASIAWAGAVVSLGYFFGRNVESLVSDLALIIAAAIVAGAVVVWLVVRARRRSHGGS
jgi:membrane-associated protein